jgi:hypothetical protein
MKNSIICHTGHPILFELILLILEARENRKPQDETMNGQQLVRDVLTKIGGSKILFLSKLERMAVIAKDTETGTEFIATGVEVRDGEIIISISSGCPE